MGRSINYYVLPSKLEHNTNKFCINIETEYNEYYYIEDIMVKLNTKIKF